MLLIRSWPPDPIPAGHARIMDQILRVQLSDPFDYMPLCSLGSDVLHLDWDTAAGPEGLEHFARHARKDPARVLVAPCRVYPGSLHGDRPRQMSGPEWNVRAYLDGQQAMRQVVPREATADLFGFGMVYLPQVILLEYVTQRGPAGDAFTDIGFAGWYFNTYGPARLCWRAAPVHLNFPPPRL